MSQRIEWTEDKLEYIREHFADESISDIAYELRLSPGVVKLKAVEMGLQKSENWTKRRYFNRYVRKYKYGGYRSSVQGESM